MMSLIKLVAFFIFAFSAIEATSELFCFQCQSLPGDYNEKCVVGDIRLIKRCPAEYNYCSVKAIYSTDENNEKQISLHMNCARTMQSEKCITVNGSTICSRICSENGCNKIIPELVEITPTPVVVEETSTPRYRQCYSCSGNLSSECALGVQSSEMITCPSSKPNCTVIESRFRYGNTTMYRKARSCTELLQTKCITPDICYYVCNEDFCNNF